MNAYEVHIKSTRFTLISDENSATSPFVYLNLAQCVLTAYEAGELALSQKGTF